MKKGILILFVAWLAIVTATQTHIYPYGVYVTLPGGHWCGWEIRPTWGGFCDVD